MTNTKAEATEFWNQCHSENNQLYLTGSEGEEVWKRLNILQRINSKKVILNIGVGMGYCTQKLAATGAEIDAHDISEVALERVIPYTTNRYLSTDLEKLPRNHYDIAISHLVAQHMNNEALQKQLNAVVASLNNSGIFAIQIAYYMLKIDKADESLANLKDGGVCRHLHEFYEMVQKANGRIVWTAKVGQFDEYKSGWYAFHIIKNTEECYINYLKSSNILAISNSLLMEGKERIVQEDYLKAEKALLLADSLYPENLEVKRSLALVKMMLGDILGSTELYAEVLELKNDDKMANEALQRINGRISKNQIEVELIK